MGWFLSRRHFVTDVQAVPDLACYPELRWLDRRELAVPIVLAALIFALDEVLAVAVPQLETRGAQLLFWGYFFSTVVLIHVFLVARRLLCWRRFLMRWRNVWAR